MINVSQLSEYIYCPRKVYIRHTEDSNIQTDAMVVDKITRIALRGFEELIKRNLWQLNGEMSVKKLLESLFEDIPEFLDTVYQIYQDEINDRNIDTYFTILKEDLKFDSWLIATKAYKIFKTGQKGSNVAEILFPSCLIEFRIENREIGLRGVVDKIEIVDGNYYPIKLKTGLPPVNRIWHSDAMQITAYSILMEQEFNKEIPVGFLNYMKVGIKKTVLVNSILRENFLKIMEEIRYILDEGLIPKFVQNANKCRKCDYAELCKYSTKLQ